MKTLLLCLLASLLYLLPAPTWACTICRPKVQAAIHNADYPVNVALLLLPVAVLLLLGLGLYYADGLVAWGRARRQMFVLPASL